MGRPRTEQRLGACHRPTIAGRIRIAREMRGLTIPRFGALIGVSPQQVSNYECGRHSLSAGTLVEVARVLDLPVTFFLDDCAVAEHEAPAAVDLPPAACTRIAADCAVLPDALRHQVEAFVLVLAETCRREAGQPTLAAAE